MPFLTIVLDYMLVKRQCVGIEAIQGYNANIT